MLGKMIPNMDASLRESIVDCFQTHVAIILPSTIESNVRKSTIKGEILWHPIVVLAKASC